MWEREVLRRIVGSDFTAVGLHDCYAHLWLSHYPRLLEKIAALGGVIPLTRVANEVFLGTAE